MLLTLGTLKTPCSWKLVHSKIARDCMDQQHRINMSQDVRYDSCLLLIFILGCLQILDLMNTGLQYLHV